MMACNRGESGESRCQYATGDGGRESAVNLGVGTRRGTGREGVATWIPVDQGQKQNGPTTDGKLSAKQNGVVGNEGGLCPAME